MTKLEELKAAAYDAAYAVADADAYAAYADADAAYDAAYVAARAAARAAADAAYYDKLKKIQEMNMCGEIENCQHEIEKLKESFFTLSFRSETMDRKEREAKLEDVRTKLLDVTDRFNMLLEIDTAVKGGHHD